MRAGSIDWTGRSTHTQCRHPAASLLPFLPEAHLVVLLHGRVLAARQRARLVEELLADNDGVGRLLVEVLHLHLGHVAAGALNHLVSKKEGVKVKVRVSKGAIVLFFHT